MSADHKRPLFAFVVVVVMCALIIANTLRSQAAPGVLRDPEARIVAGSELVTEPARPEIHSGLREPVTAAVSEVPAGAPSQSQSQAAQSQAAQPQAAQSQPAQPQAAQYQPAAAGTTSPPPAAQPASQSETPPTTTPVVHQPSSTPSGGHQPAGHALGHLLGQHGAVQQLAHGAAQQLAHGVGQQLAHGLGQLAHGVAQQLAHDNRGGHGRGLRSHGHHHANGPRDPSTPEQAPVVPVDEPDSAAWTFGGESWTFGSED